MHPAHLFTTKAAFYLFNWNFWLVYDSYFYIWMIYMNFGTFVLESEKKR